MPNHSRMVFPSSKREFGRPAKGRGSLDPTKQFQRVGLPQPGAPPPIHPGIGRRVNTTALLEQIRADRIEKVLVESFAEASRHPARVGLAIWPGPPWWAESCKEHQNVTIRPSQPGHVIHAPQPRWCVFTVSNNRGLPPEFQEPWTEGVLLCAPYIVWLHRSNSQWLSLSDVLCCLISSVPRTIDFPSFPGFILCFLSSKNLWLPLFDFLSYHFRILQELWTFHFPLYQDHQLIILPIFQEPWTTNDFLSDWFPLFARTTRTIILSHRTIDFSFLSFHGLTMFGLYGPLLF